MVLTKVQITSAQLIAMPKNDRVFFIQIGNLLNDLNILQKLIFVSAKYTEDTLERRGRNLQALLLVRIHAGKLWEAWELLKRDFFGAKLSHQYEPELDGDAKHSLGELKKYFSRKNIIYKIRNEFAFHYSSANDIENQINSVPNSETFDLLLAKEHGNCLYCMSDVILNYSLLNAVDPSDPQRAIETILDEICAITKHFLDFLGGCLVLIWDKYIGGDNEQIEIGTPPSLEDLILPYFISR
jgi:hypothetical protein